MLQLGYIYSENEFVFARKIEIAKRFKRMISVFDIPWEQFNKRGHSLVY